MNKILVDIIKIAGTGVLVAFGCRYGSNGADRPDFLRGKWFEMPAYFIATIVMGAVVIGIWLLLWNGAALLYTGFTHLFCWLHWCNCESL